MPQVKLFTTPTCGYCRHTKQFFAEHGIQYTEANVATDLDARNEMLTKSGQMGVPVILVDNNVVVGYDPERLSELLGIHG